MVYSWTVWKLMCLCDSVQGRTLWRLRPWRLSQFQLSQLGPQQATKPRSSTRHRPLPLYTELRPLLVCPACLRCLRQRLSASLSPSFLTGMKRVCPR